MFAVLLILLLLDGILMSVIVLLQSGKGGGLAAVGGGSGGTMADQLIGGRQAATLLTKATWITGGLFLGLALLLSVMSSRSINPSSVLQQEFQQPQPIVPPPATPPGGEGAGQRVPGTEPANPATGTGTVPPTTTSGN